MQNETIKSLQKAIKAYEQREAEMLETIASLVAAQDASIRLQESLCDEIEQLQEAVIQLSKTQKKNTEFRKKFEPLYWKQIG